MKHRIKYSEGGSKFIGKLPTGCKMCIRGEKMVLFMGGLCELPIQCSWYCPVSKERKNSEQIFADEIKINNIDGAIKEAKLIKAKGCSFTGGDPLRNQKITDVTISYLKRLKQVFNNKFHVHLYTCGKNFTRDIAMDLAEAGLDEIRFHPARGDFNRIEYALNLGMQVGAEVPVIPDQQNEKYIFDLIEYLDNVNVDFINLNEFEMNEPNFRVLKKKGFELEDGTIASVSGSKKLADRILNECQKRSTMSVHYCPISLKDGPQLRNRYKRRASSIKMPFEEITKDGTLLFLRVNGEETVLNEIFREFLINHGVPKNLIEFSSNTIAEKHFMDLPWLLSKDKAFLEFLKNHNLSAGIMEILPFRDEYSEICEYTPINTKN